MGVARVLEESKLGSTAAGAGQDRGGFRCLRGREAWQSSVILSTCMCIYIYICTHTYTYSQRMYIYKIIYIYIEIDA